MLTSQKGTYVYNTINGEGSTGQMHAFINVLLNKLKIKCITLHLSNIKEVIYIIQIKYFRLISHITLNVNKVITYYEYKQ